MPWYEFYKKNSRNKSSDGSERKLGKFNSNLKLDNNIYVIIFVDFHTDVRYMIKQYIAVLAISNIIFTA